MINFTIPTAQMGFYNADMDYVLEPGEIEIMIGAASDDVRLTERIMLTGKTQKVEKVLCNKIEIFERGSNNGI